MDVAAAVQLSPYRIAHCRPADGLRDVSAGDIGTAQDRGKRREHALKLRLRHITVLLATALSACATLEPALPTPSPVRASWSNAHAASVDEPPAWTDRWWEQFGSAELDALVTTALRDNPGLEAARERLVAARALQSVATSPFQPAVALASGPAATPGSRESYFQAGVDATWELPLFDRQVNGSRILASRTASAEAGVAEAQSALIAETVHLYLDGSIAGAQVQVADKLMGIAAARQERTAARLSLGIDEQDAHRTSLQQSREARANLQQARLVQVRSLESLVALTGRNEPDASWLAHGDTPPVPPALPSTFPRDLLRRRPDVLFAQAAVLKSAAELGIARAEMYPHINLAGALTVALGLGGGMAGGVSSMVAAGPVINLPLFDWGMRRAQIRADGAGLRASALTYRQVVLDAIAECELAFLQLNAANQHLAIERSAADALRTSAERAATRRQLGLLGQVQELDAARDALLAQQAVGDAQWQQAVAVVHAYKVLGAGTGIASASVSAW